MSQYKAKTAEATLAFYDFVFTYGGGVLGESSEWTATIRFSKSLGSVTRPPQTWNVVDRLYNVDEVKDACLSELYEFLQKHMTPHVEVNVSEVVVETDEPLSDEVDDEDEVAPVIPLRKDLTNENV